MLCTCDKMGAPWVVKDAMPVIIIILTMCLKIGHGATLHHATISIGSVGHVHDYLSNKPAISQNTTSSSVPVSCDFHDEPFPPDDLLNDTPDKSDVTFSFAARLKVKINEINQIN